MTKSWKDYLFVSIQFLLFGLYAFDFLPHFELPQIIKYIGLIVSITGFIILALSVLQLNKNLTVFPTPKSDSELITFGMYKFSRHPIYTGLILFTFGYAFYKVSWLKLVISLSLFLLFYFKTNYEEQQLLQKFTDYKEYKKKINRFFPKIKKPQE
ncbi:Protein-S-isoprenylcysteine O-methyltransferase Ste14 [Flavobacterium micromati]|jgi:protein-S-isoprenylcysteine O-methyltransferase Ste14|uniref:Protein-S-isoprenylcysteine O-methyltransferase Ste14 n=1 Tax=Flavobacterium micromati TaxID=229205 RepID=A0A1M5P4U2_9FLAO|nr:isoprenylcysteine carboxylmethyltransferase family protein [Flavobacterium micromati]MCL6462630.1 isoprenylcysteine carboxylmethyltransferase family protein [Flavobacterium micromati]SHG96826.1 Protein-S-isoprenylcysteine O-methyltransferase Ste14 [Flavobacterium micromati]